MISETPTINRLLASVSVLEVSAWAKGLDVAEYYTTQYVYPVRDAFGDAQDFCVRANLLEIDKSQIRLTGLGKAYLDLGEKKAKMVILEPNQKQKDFLSRNVFLTSAMLDLTKKVLYHFDKGTDGTLQLPKERARALDDQNFLGLLLQVGILIDKGEFIEFVPRYAELVEGFISNNLLVVTPEEFEEAEAEKRELAMIAEEFVLRSERMRLKKVGAVEQSEAVDHVALKNVAAGYDIASFDDQKSSIHDRFVEVKAGKSTPINFFLSRNELETAKRLKEKYFIYYVCIKNKKPQELFIFCNPAETVMKDGKFATRTDTYEISEK